MKKTKKKKKKDEITGQFIIVLGHSLVDGVVSISHEEFNGLLSEMSIIFKWLGSLDACYMVDTLSTI